MQSVSQSIYTPEENTNTVSISNQEREALYLLWIYHTTGKQLKKQSATNVP